MKNKLSKLTGDTSSWIVQEYIADKTDHQILHPRILLTIECCFGNCKPKNLMLKMLQKSKYPTEMLYFLAEHTLIMYIQFRIGSKRKTSPLLEKSSENNFEHIVSDTIFKRLNFDYSSSETVLIQRIKLRAIFFVSAYSWRSD